MLQLISASPKEIDAACEFLLAAIKARGPSLGSLRLFDLLASLSFRYRKHDMLNNVIGLAEKYGNVLAGVVEFSDRSARWRRALHYNDEKEPDKKLKWERKWLRNITRKYWGNLPM